MKSTELAQKIAKAPKTPGVYIWRNISRKPIYIGKATNIKNRLSNYRRTSDSRILAMIADATTLTWRTTATDIDALLLESTLIKRFNPKFNIMMRDDKQYFYVQMSDENFPKLSITHQPKDGHAFGPFTEGTSLKTTLRLVRKLFPFCTCTRPHHLKCLNAHIGKCFGFCCLRAPASIQQQRTYAESIRAIQAILSGKRSSLVSTLEQEMKAAGARHDFERALDLQKKIEHVIRVFENARIVNRESSAPQDAPWKNIGLRRVPQRIEGYDVANIQGQHAAGSMVVMSGGRADRNQYRRFNIKTTARGDTAMLHEILERRLKHFQWPLPDLIVVDGGRAQLNAVRKAMTASEKQGTEAKTVHIVAFTKNDHHRGDHIFFYHPASHKRETTKLADLPRVVRDMIVSIDNEAHRFAIAHYRWKHRRQNVVE